MATNASGSKVIEGRFVAAVVVTFFAIVIAMNGVFLAAALRTNTGVVAVEPYRKGLHYNDRIDADARQRALGWQGEAKVEGGHLVVDIHTADGTAIRGLTVEAIVGRPATIAENTNVALIESASGLYAAAQPISGSGAFIVDVTASERGYPVFQLRRRIWLQP